MLPAAGDWRFSRFFHEGFLRVFCFLFILLDFSVCNAGAFCRAGGLAFVRPLR